MDIKIEQLTKEQNLVINAFLKTIEVTEIFKTEFRGHAVICDGTENIITVLKDGYTVPQTIHDVNFAYCKKVYEVPVEEEVII